MDESELERVVRHLATVLEKERREAIAYTLLTVLCTPVFVAMASLAIGVVLVFILWQSDYRFDAFTIYTGMVFFLGSMLALVLINSRDSPEEVQFSKVWLAAAGVFLLLLVLTYGTSLPQRSPSLFGILFAGGGLLVLGLLGQVRLADHVTEGTGTWKDLFVGVMAVCGLIIAAYGELLSASWLWVPPKPHEVRIAARVLCRLAGDPNEPLSRGIVDDRVTRLLSRLKLAQATQQQLVLTPKGMDFFQAATKQ